MKVWIDTLSGTWGECDGSLVLADIPESMANEWMAGTSDSTISDYGLTKGFPVDFEETDNEGQYLIYTGIYKKQDSTSRG